MCMCMCMHMPTCMYIDIYFKKLALATVGLARPKFAGQACTLEA